MWFVQATATTKEAGSRHGVTVNITFSYSYDKLNRLTNRTGTGTVMSDVLTYDDMGIIR